MKKFFNLENPIWKFIGNLADFFLLSVLWYICAALIIPFGAGTTALYSVDMKIATNEEGYILKGFWDSFKSNFKQGTQIGLIFQVVGLVLFADFYWIFFGNPKVGIYFLPVAIIIGLLYILVLNLVFPLLAHYDNDTQTLLKIAVSMTFRKILPIFAYTLLIFGFFAFGIFVFWPILLVTPGLGGYIASFILKRIFDQYDKLLGEKTSLE